MAKDRDEAERVGKIIQEQSRYDNLLNARMDQRATLDDNGLRCSLALSRGNISIHADDCYVHSDFGRWDKSSPNYKNDADLLCQMCNLDPERVGNVAIHAYPSTTTTSELSTTNGNVAAQDLMDDLVAKRCENHAGGTLFDDFYMQTESNLHGMKASLPRADRDLTELELHIRKGHVGYCEACNWGFCSDCNTLSNHEAKGGTARGGGRSRVTR